MDDLDDVRERIRMLDRRLVETVAQRMEAAKQAGKAKRTGHRPIRDYDVERDVVERIRAGFQAADLDPLMGERIARLLIAEALRIQEKQGLQPGTGSQGDALIVGGAGQMGAWFAHFLNGLGYQVTTSDPRGPLPGFPSTEEPRRAGEQSDLVILATPPDVTGEVLQGFQGVETLIFDIASLKGPFQDTLVEMAKDHNITSVHPLWGPSARVLSGKSVAILDCGNEAATDQARELFNQTAASVLKLPLHLHDRLMAYTLGLPHALNLVYAQVLSTSGHAFSELKLLGGPTFVKQNDVAAEVARENPELYRQIQVHNEDRERLYKALHEAIDALGERIQDEAAFKDAMLTYRDYLGDYHGGFPA
ncbi:MAG: prephenate dehydrogenase/arogenate dehydrogenase family protein [Candidatus Thermoplasmatota archaeon]|nr:prephenate dehydrogenase/arogenate dehydrogenase family protein [Candidatus Thermoplasmatota archaeon]